MNQFRLVIVALAVTRLATGQSPDTTHRIAGATVSGIVTDSISGVALPGAVVQLVAAEGLARSARTGYSDWLGRFSFAAVPSGRYTIGFFHPMLDSLGVDAPMRELIVSRCARSTVEIESSCTAVSRRITASTSPSPARRKRGA